MMASKEDTKTVSLALDPQAVKRLKIVALERDLTLSALMQEALERWWKQEGLDETRGLLFPVAEPPKNTPES